ncbi:hypothetical protein FYJ79_04245 [Sharpea azabuensis]|uniref:Uncharacterized protein n=1 Tax=Sharpea porci TaxID=2652286 RepID=A0A844FSZ2_9FIRM|nr:hypothetical protein [Sharpea porci]MST88793.1 hypothetical protein [Sharpea porci]
MIILKREKSFVDRFRKYTIYINDNVYGKIKNNASIEINLPSGKYEMFLMIDWCRSRTLTINVEEGQDIILECYSCRKGRNFFKTAFASILQSNDYIVLQFKH